MNARPESTARGFRPSARRRNRIAAGVALAAVAVGGNVVVYSGLDDGEPVVQAIRDIPAGAVITDDMLRTVEASIDPTVQAIPGDELSLVPGRYARVRIVSGSLVTRPALLPEPLVTEGRSVVAVRVPDGTLPAGLLERARVQLVIPATGGDATPVVVEGRAVSLPSGTGDALGEVSVSVEVDAADAPVVAASDDVRVVLLDQRDDPAAEPDDPAAGRDDASSRSADAGEG